MATTQPAYSSAENTASLDDSGRFTDKLWVEITTLRASIDSLEFLRRLGDGTLPLDAFRRYIEQDQLYLDGYSKALSLVSAHAPDAQAAGFWANSASTAVSIEAALHEGMLTGGVLPESTGRSEHSQACLGYVSYLIATAATAPYPVSAAAVLPCFWIYAEVGRALAASAREVLDADPSHPYAQWVTTYDAPEFHESVAQARALVDAAAESSTEADRAAMSEAFRIASRYELMFWDSALNQQHWPAS
ncbi:TenA family protein [Rhodococcus sp. IEGM 1379]|uniref:TenA family protein n=1 Tax=Rhodococcus sp. IEGM 1379 TaxID=3047086 RepID=UPI0024B69CBC|nr:TenA family protein [Rhodococcus sp. IEGM 1379]MDI9916299.1 TenA family protein [Rhodococcus sp. IEGM 1379]